MLKDITIGQFFPGNSIIHRMDSRFKIVLSLIYVIMLFVAQNFYGIGLSGIFILMVFFVSISLIFALICMISFLLLTLGLVCSSLLSCFGCKVSLFI